MYFSEKWIWLPKEMYPNRQKHKVCAFSGSSAGLYYTVAEFKRDYSFEKDIKSMTLRVSADTAFILWCNGEFLATGPVSVGGDSLRETEPRDNYYSTEITLQDLGNRLEFFSRVKLSPGDLFEFSKGHGGFMLTAHVTFSDGTKTVLLTDRTWKVRFNGSYTSFNSYDGRIAPDEYVNAEEIDNLWLTRKSPLPPRVEKERGVTTFTLLPGAELHDEIELDMIYAGFSHVRVRCDGEVRVTFYGCEIDIDGYTENLIFTHDDDYRGFKLHSAGKIVLDIQNLSDSPAEVTVSLIGTHLPVGEAARITTSDSELDLILDVCRHTLKQCRQTLHLDSPKHCEPLMCTGDYYIETLMTVFSFGDMTLAEFDVARTAELFRKNDGRIFHTSYSLIWVRWMYDVYMLTGNVDLLRECEDALILLLNRFETYMGDNGIIEYPPDYMFVDWIYIDGITLHRPPKALGQSCLNMYYHGALDAAEKIFRVLGEEAMARTCLVKREALKTAVNSILYDSERGMYFEGLNTKTPEHLLDSYSMPQNVDKRYYLKQSNILAVCFGVCDGERAVELVHKIMSDEVLGDYQPYFAHYLLESIYKCGLRDEYMLRALDRWREPVRECPKGLAEGFLPPEPTYKFDHSHAWGGSPLYSLPRALTGFEILEAGMKKIRLSPSLLGLSEAYVELPTPYGKVTCSLKAGEESQITTPDGISVVIE